MQYHGADLLGLGVAAFSYCQGVHFQNVPHLHDYLDRLARRELPLGRAYLLSGEEQMRRELVLQLKLGGVSRPYFQRKFNVDVRERFGDTLAILQAAGWLRIMKDEIRLTRAGLLRADRLLREFYLPEHQAIAE